MVKLRTGPGCGWRAVGFAALLAAGASGCVERRYTIRSDPPGALVIVNNEEIGTTPVSRSFTFYGDREVVLSKDGYQTQRVIQPVDAPWYDNLLTEAVTENFVPYTFRDNRDFTYTLSPEVATSTPELLSRGEALRARALNPPPARRGGLLGFFGF